MATSAILLYGLWREFYFFLTRVVPVAALSLSIGVLVLSFMAPGAPIDELAVVLMVPLMLFQVFLRIVRAVMAGSPQQKLPRGPLFQRVTGRKAWFATAIYVYGIVLVTVAVMFVVARPVYIWLGLDWPTLLIVLIAVGHFVGGILLVMTAVTLAELFAMLDNHSQSGRSLLAVTVATYR